MLGSVSAVGLPLDYGNWLKRLETTSGLQMWRGYLFLFMKQIMQYAANCKFMK